MELANNSFLLLVFFLAAFWYTYKLPYCYHVARKTGLPIYLCPISPAHLFWVISLAAWQPQLEHYLPRFIYKRLRPCIYGWEYRERYNMQAELGPSFVLVTPSGIEVWTADPDAASQILSRRRDFSQMEITARIMSMFGHNLTSCDDNEWGRHRRIVAPVLNERIMAAVWAESRSQARQMMDTFTNHGAQETAETYDALEGLKILAVNVMLTVAYGERIPWALEASYGKAPPGYSVGFVEAMKLVVDHLLAAAFVSTRLLSLGCMPAGARKLAAAKNEFPRYASALISQQRKSEKIQDNLIATLVRAADEASRESKSKLYLSESEIIGNIFNITIAGFDTTANAIAYAFLAFALFPEWQEWVIEELDSISSHPGTDEYQEHYPQMVRCAALLYETVRLYSPVVHITRRANGPQTLPFPVPAGTNIFVASACLHVSPDIWGPDALAFRPTRFLNLSADATTGSKETLLAEPERGTFLPWSLGPRVCPGRKMAQVEFVAVVREVLGRWRVEPALRPGETRAMATARLSALVADSQPQVSQQLRHPKEVFLRFVKREK